MRKKNNGDNLGSKNLVRLHATHAIGELKKKTLWGSGILEEIRKNSKAICFFQHYSWYVLWVKLDTKLS